MIYEQIEPFGDRRGDIQAGIVANAVRNAVAPLFRDHQRTTPLDFVPKWEPEPQAEAPPPDPKLLLQRMLALQAIHNARIAAIERLKAKRL